MADTGADAQKACEEVRRFLASGEGNSMEDMIDSIRLSSCFAEVARLLLQEAKENAFEAETSEAMCTFLSGLLTEATNRATSDSTNFKDNGSLLVEFFKAGIERLELNHDMTKTLKWPIEWCEQIMTVAYEGERCDEWKLLVVGQLLHLLSTLVEQKRVDFKLLTLAWKHLTKMSTAFRDSLASASKEKEGFDVADIMVAAITSVEETARQLLLSLENENEVVNALKFLRLYWRGFQGQFLCFASVVTLEIESGVMASVNVASILATTMQSGHLSVKTQQDVWRLLTIVLGFMEKVAADDKISEPTRQQIRALLWHDPDEMFRAITQRRDPDDTGVVMKSEQTQIKRNALNNSVRWGHLMVLVAFSAAEHHENCDGKNNRHEYDIKVLDAARNLMARYRECALLSVSWTKLHQLEDIFLDMLLSVLLKVESIGTLQLFLLDQTFAPHPAQKYMIWEIWRELLCHCLNETLAIEMLETLLKLTQWEGESSVQLVTSMQSELLDIIAFIYPDMPISLKRLCIDQATVLIDTVCSEGPGHIFTLQTASHFNLLEMLCAASFIKEYEHPDKEEWISKYLPMCFECCGTILDLLTKDTSASIKRDEKNGMFRVLDVCLLVIKAVFDDNEAREADVDELSGILMPMSTETLSELVKLECTATKSVHLGNRSTIGGRLSKPKRTTNSILDRRTKRCIARVLETCMYLLGKLDGVLKQNQNNRCVQAMKDIMLLSEQYTAQDRTGRMMTIAWFMKSALYDIQVNEADMEVVWQLLTRIFGKLFELDGRSVIEQKIATLQLLTTFNAYYKLIAHSNVVEHRNESLSSLLRDKKSLFVDYIATMKMEYDEAVVAIESALKAGFLSHKTSDIYHRTNGENLDEAIGVINKRGGELLGADQEEHAIVSRKRQKLSHLSSICKEMCDAIVLMQEAAGLDILTDKELDEGSRILGHLLTKASQLSNGSTTQT